MSAAPASIRAAILRVGKVGCVLLPGCVSAAPARLVGVSDAWPEAPAPRATVEPRPAWADFAAARGWPEAAPAVPALAHYRDGTLIRVRVEAPGLEAYRALSVGAPMPDGARVAAFHESPSGESLGVYLLTKTRSAWTALELDASGRPRADSGASCIRCHDLAPTDHLFGVASRAASQ